jgi:Uma2 family endonuclease
MRGMALDFQRHRFSAADYEAMVAAGILKDGDRVELLEGEVVDMAPIGPPHAACVRRLTRLFVTRLGDVDVSVQNPLRLSDLSEPEPDVTLLAPRPGDYEEGHPRPEDVLLLVAVADSALLRDRERKLPLYAQAGIPEVWIVDLTGRAVECHRDPGPDGYARTDRLAPGQHVAPAAFPGVAFAVAEILSGRAG